MLARKVSYGDQEISNERLELTDKGSLYFLGSNLVMRHCTLVLKVPASQLILKGVQFIDCTFEVKQELKNHQSWLTTSLKGCRFKGRLMGCDFGHWPDYSDQPWYQHGAIEDCDFTEARMDGCRIIDCDPSTLRFPKWPCFTFLDPAVHAAKLRRAQWPGLFGRVLIENLHRPLPHTRARTYHAPSVARRMETTEEELKAVLEKFDCIVF